MSRRAYILVFSEQFGTEADVRAYIDSLSEVINWRRNLPNCFFLISEDSAGELYELLRKRFPTGNVIVSEIAGNEQGWLDKLTWKMINEKLSPSQMPK